jgi:hypothetical protein
MKAWKIVLPLVLLSVASAALAQDGYNSASMADVTPARIIVHWRHFGQAPAASLPANSTQSLAQDPPSPADPPADPPASQAAQAPAQPSPQVSEEDISKKHPHPPEPVNLPAALQTAPPVSNAGNVEPLPASAPAALASLPQSSESTESNGPDAQMASITASYQNRDSARRAQLEELTAQATDPSMQEAVEIERTRLLLAGEEDRARTAQQLSEAFAALAGELDSQAGKLRGLGENRSQTALTAQAELSHLGSLTPAQETSLQNLAMLPASGQSDQMMRGLNQELTHEESARTLDNESSTEAGGELKALQTQAAQMEQVAAEARARSARLADVARAAQAQENLLRDRLQYAIARQKAQELLSGASQAVDQAPNLSAGDASLSALPPVTAGAAKPPAASQGVDQLRDCIRKTGNVDACRAKGGQQ